MQGDPSLNRADATGAYQYRGNLAETTLPEVLATIDRFQVPGVIEASQQEVVKRVYIKEGNVIHASSSDRNDSLGAHLLRTGKLTETQFTETMAAREKSNRRYGVILIERGLLSPAEVYQAVREQIEAIVWSLFYWDDGSVTFRIGDFQEADAVKTQLPMRQVILEGIKRAPNPKALVARLGKKETVFEPCYRMEELIEVALNQQEFQLLGLVDGKRTLYEVCTQGPFPAADNARLMYAYQVLGLIRRAPRPEPTGGIKIRLKTEGGKYTTT